MNKVSSFPNMRCSSMKQLNDFALAKDYDVAEGCRSAFTGKAQDSAIDEKALINSARQGDLQAFNRMVIAYQDRAYSQAYYLLGDPMAADDIVQEAFITIYKALPSYRGGLFRSWLLRIVTNKCLDELRRQKSHPMTGFDAIDPWGEEVESPYWSADSAETPEESLIRTELDRYLLCCLDRLSTEYRTAIVLVDLFDMHYEEAAEMIGCPIGTIKSRLARARFQMQQFLREDPNTFNR